MSHQQSRPRDVSYITNPYLRWHLTGRPDKPSSVPSAPARGALPKLPRSESECMSYTHLSRVRFDKRCTRRPECHKRRDASTFALGRHLWSCRLLTDAPQSLDDLKRRIERCGFSTYGKPPTFCAKISGCTTSPLRGCESRRNRTLTDDGASLLGSTGQGEHLASSPLMRRFVLSTRISSLAFV